MKLNDLLKGIRPDEFRLQSAGGRGVDITGIVHDSRKVKPGYLFAAIKGVRDDGHNFLDVALKNGAAAALVSGPTPLPFPAVIETTDTRRLLSLISKAFYGDPTRSLTSIAVTGTKGKTTSVILMASVLDAAGIKAGWIGTLGAQLDAGESPKQWNLENTTPEGDDFLRILSDFIRHGAKAAAFEASSHALALHKMAGVSLDVAIFTNLSQDHLDFHHSFDEYFDAKKKLFTEIDQKKGFAGFVNADDPYGIRLQSEVGGLHGFGVKNGEVRALSVSLLANGSTFEVRSPHSSPFPVFTPLLGEHNLYNVLGVVAAALHLGAPPEAIRHGIERVNLIPGRMEPVETGQKFSVIVDYAHTPDSLLKVLASTRRFTQGRVLCVFGCGGDRDTGKRPKMGRIAAELSDQVFITSDNPRTEEPESILCHILAGVPLNCAGKIHLTADRKAAIHEAVHTAEPGDTLIIAGKGHETYQILKDKTVHFDDREEAKRALLSLGTG